MSSISVQKSPSACYISTITHTQKGVNMTYKWNSIWHAELYTLAGRHMTTVKFRVKEGSTRADVLAKLEGFKGGRERTYTAYGICSMTKRQINL